MKKLWSEQRWKVLVPAIFLAHAACAAALYPFTGEIVPLLVLILGCASATGVILRSHVRTKRELRKAVKRKADEAEVDLDELKARLEEIGPEAFDREADKIQVRVPQTNPPAPHTGPVRTVSELLADDIDPEVVGVMLAEGRARHG